MSRCTATGLGSRTVTFPVVVWVLVSLQPSVQPPNTGCLKNQSKKRPLSIPYGETDMEMTFSMETQLAGRHPIPAQRGPCTSPAVPPCPDGVHLPQSVSGVNREQTAASQVGLPLHIPSLPCLWLRREAEKNGFCWERTAMSVSPALLDGHGLLEVLQRPL